MAVYGYSIPSSYMMGQDLNCLTFQQQPTRLSLFKKIPLDSSLSEAQDAVVHPPSASSLESRLCTSPTQSPPSFPGPSRTVSLPSPFLSDSIIFFPPLKLWVQSLTLCSLWVSIDLQVISPGSQVSSPVITKFSTEPLDALNHNQGGVTA